MLLLSPHQCFDVEESGLDCTSHVSSSCGGRWRLVRRICQTNEFSNLWYLLQVEAHLASFGSTTRPKSERMRLWTSSILLSSMPADLLGHLLLCHQAVRNQVVGDLQSALRVVRPRLHRETIA